MVFFCWGLIASTSIFFHRFSVKKEWMCGFSILSMETHLQKKSFPMKWGLMGWFQQESWRTTESKRMNLVYKILSKRKALQRSISGEHCIIMKTGKMFIYLDDHIRFRSFQRRAGTYCHESPLFRCRSRHRLVYTLYVLNSSGGTKG